MKIGSIALLLVCACVMPVCAQQNTSAPMNSPGSSTISSSLRTTSRARIAFNGALVGNARCDADGNIYFRILDAENSKQSHATYKLPIQRIKPDGSRIGIFKFTDAAPDLYASDFFVTDDGKVYLEAFRPSDFTVFVLEFANDGSLKSIIEPDAAPFRPRQIVVFKTGEFLLSGTNGESHATPFSAVFDRSGQLIKAINEPEDEYARQRATQGDRDFLPPRDSSWDNTSVAHGDAALGSDGNAYLLRATSPALIYVISSRGQVLRKLKIDSPSGLVAQRLKAAHGKLAISFLESYSTIGQVGIVDMEGNFIATHTPDDQTIYPGLPGCYDSQSFTFLHAGAENEVTLQKAEPK